MLKITLNINKTFYPEEVVLEAITLFEGYKIIYINGVLTIEDENPALVLDELLNYCLSIYAEKV